MMGQRLGTTCYQRLVGKIDFVLGVRVRGEFRSLFSEQCAGRLVVLTGANASPWELHHAAKLPDQTRH